jgi:hypothetical protein
MINKIKYIIGFLFFTIALKILETETIYNLCILSIKEIEKYENVENFNINKIKESEVK